MSNLQLSTEPVQLHLDSRSSSDSNAVKSDKYAASLFPDRKCWIWRNAANAVNATASSVPTDAYAVCHSGVIL